MDPFALDNSDMNTPSLDLQRKESLERVVQEFGNLIVKSIESLDLELFEASNYFEREELLTQADMYLSAAEGCVNAMQRIWFDGEDVYDRFLLGITELRKRRYIIQEFFNVVSQDIPVESLRSKTQTIVAKNREVMMIAGTYLEEATDILYKQTGIELKLE